MVLCKDKRWNGWDLNKAFELYPLKRNAIVQEKLAEVVGSTPTRSISYYEGTTALYGASFGRLSDKTQFELEQ
jgi:hypothetical protein